MQEATVSDLKKNLPKVLRWVEAGEAVQIRRRGKVVALMMPPTVEGESTEVVRPAGNEGLEVGTDRVSQLDQLLQDPMLTEEEVARMTGEAKLS